MTGRGLILLMLVSGCFWVCDLQTDGTIRRFRYVGLLRNWTEAQSYCREKFADLATIQNQANVTEAQEATGSSQFWIGLYRGPWFLFQENLNNDSVPKWNTSEPESGQCPVIGKDGSLSSMGCTSTFTYFCASAVFDDRNYLITHSYSWKGAQTYCRTFYKDLSNIKSQTQHNDITDIMQSYSYPFAWIGLDSQFFRWSDGSTSSYTKWNSLNSDTGGDCVMMDASSGTWFWRPCSEKHFFLCGADIQLPRSNVRTVKVRMRAGSADLNHPEVQDAIIQQLKQRMEERGIMQEVKLRWKMQPDGRVFHREGETAPPGVCEKDDVCVTL